MKGKHAFRAAVRAMNEIESSSHDSLDRRKVLLDAALEAVGRCPVSSRVRTKAVLYAFKLRT